MIYKICIKGMLELWGYEKRTHKVSTCSFPYFFHQIFVRGKYSMRLCLLVGLLWRLFITWRRVFREQIAQVR